MTLAEINSATDEALALRLTECCGSSRWVRGMLARRPFRDEAKLMSAADEVWRELTSQDWLEAFSKHPKIGETRKVSQWSAQEQSGMHDASVTVTERLASLNTQYFAKFGFIFIVCATGKSAAEMLGLLEARLPNTIDVELSIAAAEQAKITKIRLEKLLAS